MEPERRKSTTWKRRIAGAALTAVAAAAVYVGYGVWFGGRIGDLCETASDCSWAGLGDSVCLQMYWGYCTRPCRSPRDCPAGWICDLKHPQGQLCIKR